MRYWSRDAEHGLELADEVKRRNPYFTREILDGWSGIIEPLQQLPGTAETTKAFVPQEHRRPSYYESPLLSGEIGPLT